MSAERQPATPAAKVVLLLGLLVLFVVALVVLDQRAPRRSGTNLTADVGYGVPLAPSKRLCEPGEMLPGDTGALRIDATTSGAPTLPALEFTLDGETGHVVTGTLRAGAKPGKVLVPLMGVVRNTQGGTVCVQNNGSTPVLFGGSVPDGGFAIEDAGQPFGGRLRIEYMRPGRESWLGLLPTLAYRFSLAKSDIFRHWEAAAVLVLMLIAIALTVRTLLRPESP